MRDSRVDVVVVGAGPAGAHAAARMARAGLEVMLVDRNPRGGAGAQWLNGVTLWQFEAARCALPTGPELFAGEQPFTMLSPDGSARLHVESSPVLELDMRHLGERLAGEVSDAATGTLAWGQRAGALEVDRSGRAVALDLEDLEGGEKHRVSASLFVDATGLAAVLRKQHPLLSELCPVPPAEHLCRASQELRDVDDPEGAQAFLAERGGRPEEALSYVGVAGGYSLLRAAISEDLDHVSLLTGSAAVDGQPSGRKILDTFVAEQPWIGDVRFGGSRTIPLRRPYAHLVAPGLALLGDAASQVYSAHGSGIGIGLIAASLLADAAIEAHRSGQDPGSLEALWPYPRRFHREYGGVLGASDLFRRFSQELTAAETTSLIREGLLNRSMVLDGLLQKPPKVQPRELPAQLRGMARVPRIARRLVPVLAKMPVIYAVARAYPSRPGLDSRALARWDRAMARLVGS